MVPFSKTFRRALGPRRAGVPRLCGGAASLGVGVQNKGDDETVKTQDLSENENQNHSDEEPGLLGSAADTGISNNTDGEASGKTGKTDTETGTEVNEARKEGVGIEAQSRGDEDSHDQTVDGNDTSHDHGDDGLHDELRAHDGHGGDSDSTLGGSVGGTEGYQGKTTTTKQETKAVRVPSKKEGNGGSNKEPKILK